MFRRLYRCGEGSNQLVFGHRLVRRVTITATFSYLQEAKSEKIMEGFKNMIPKKCKCIRDGKNTVVDAWELVPGGVPIYRQDQVPISASCRQTN